MRLPQGQSVALDFPIKLEFANFISFFEMLPQRFETGDVIASYMSFRFFSKHCLGLRKSPYHEDGIVQPPPPPPLPPHPPLPPTKIACLRLNV